MLNESFFKKYFKQGDYVQVDNKTGKLLNFSKNHVLIETDNGNPLFFSMDDNLNFSIENLSRPHRIQRLEIRLPLPMSPQLVKEILEVSLQKLLHVRTDSQDYEIQLIDFLENKSVYKLTFRTTGKLSENKIHDAVFSAVWYEFRRRNIHLETGGKLTKPVLADKKNIDSVVNFIQNNELFNIFSEADLQILAKKAKKHLLGVPECLGKEGEKRDSLFVIESGKANIVINDSKKGFVKLAQIGKNDIFGEMALLTGETRSASAEVVEEMVAYEISKTDILPILQKNSRLIDELSRLLAKRQLENKQILNSDKTTYEEADIQSSAKVLHELMWSVFG